MKHLLTASVLTLSLFIPVFAHAEYTCTGTFLKASGDYEKGAQITVFDYYYKKGVLVYGVPKVGFMDAKIIKLNKDCALEKLERRLDLETAF